MSSLPPMGTAEVVKADSRNLPYPDDSVDLIITSPPYFCLRSYQDGGEHYAGQIGDEPTPAEFVASLLEVTRECVRVLKPTGSLWVNLGDKYSTRIALRKSSHQDGLFPDREDLKQDWKASKAAGQTRMPYQNITNPSTGAFIPEKSLMGIPWRYALACIDELGLILRAEVIWSKPNGLPESVTDRVRRSHEQWFHFTLQPRYFSAVDEIREEHAPQSIARTKRNRDAPDLSQQGVGAPNTLNPADACNPLGKLPSSVWQVPDDSEDSLVRCTLLAISTGSLTVEEGERILGTAWTTSAGSTQRSTGQGSAGSGPQDSHLRGTGSSGLTAGQSLPTGSPTPTTSAPYLQGYNSTTCAGDGHVCGLSTCSPSQYEPTCSAGRPLSQHKTQPRLTAPTATSSTTPTPTSSPETEVACAECVCAPETVPDTGVTDRSPGSVWTIATEPLKVPADLGIDHFAAFPTEWPRRIINGFSPAGLCDECGEGRRPLRGTICAPCGAFRPNNANACPSCGDKRNWKEGRVDEAAMGSEGFDGASGHAVPRHPGNHQNASISGGYECACGVDPEWPTHPAVVLDPFGGTGTTAMVAKALGRHGISVDMSADYCRLAEWRTNDENQLERVRNMQVYGVRKPTKTQIREHEARVAGALSEASASVRDTNLGSTE